MPPDVQARRRAAWPQIQVLPSASRDPLQLLQLAPGAFGTGARNNGGTENLPGTTIGGSSSAGGIFATENGGQICTAARSSRRTARA
jgi:hypothetical protein